MDAKKHVHPEPDRQRRSLLEKSEMDFLCGAVASAIATVFADEPITDWRIAADGPHVCSVTTPTFLVRFYLDPRNQLVSSSVTFLDVDEELREELYTHVIVRLFPNIPWHGETGSGPIVRRIALEVENVHNLLRAIRTSALSGRDLLYFYLGYNSGHSDCSDSAL